MESILSGVLTILAVLLGLFCLYIMVRLASYAILKSMEDIRKQKELRRKKDASTRNDES